MKNTTRVKQCFHSFSDKLATSWQSFCQDNLIFIGLMMFFSLPYLISFNGLELKRELLYFIAYLNGTFFFLILITLMTCILRPRLVKKGVRLFLLVISCLIFVAESFFIVIYNAMPDAAVLEVILSSNPRESLEYLHSYVLHPNTILALFAFAIVLYAYIQLLKRIRHVKWLHKILALLLVGSILCSVAMLVRKSERPFLDRLSDWPTRYFVIGYVANEVRHAFSNITAYEKLLQQQTTNDIVITRNEDDLPYVVFILGESTARSHMSLYGYPLETDPLLQKRKDAGELQAFTDVRAPYAQTLDAMETIFTFYHRNASENWYDYHNLFDIFKATHVNTAWLSNQESSGIANMDHFFSVKCDTFHFTMLKDFKSGSKNRYDETLLPLLDKLLVQSNSPQNFFVLHLMGSHTTYADRYPKEFEKFHSENESIGLSTVTAKQMRADYDNTILYNDYVIDKIIQRFEDKDAIIIYISDHGDEVMEDRNFFGHGKNNATHWMLEIPMIVWTSQSFRQKHPERIEAIQNATTRPYVTDDIIHSLLDLTHIETPEYQPERSIFSPNFNASYYQ